MIGTKEYRSRPHASISQTDKPVADPASARNPVLQIQKRQRKPSFIAIQFAKNSTRYDLQRCFGFGAIGIAGVNFLGFQCVIGVDDKARWYG